MIFSSVLGWEVSVAQSVILAIAFLFNLLQTPEPGPRHELILQLRYPNGRPAVGVEVSLLKLPDRTLVGWQNTDSACQIDAQGLCVWQLFGGLYEFSFAAGLTPDPITLTELGEGGLSNPSVFLDRGYAMGIVLADPLTETAGDTLFFDRKPDESLPQFFIPGPEDARQHHLVPTPTSNVVIVDLEPEAPSEAAAEEPSSVEEESNSKDGRFILVLLLIGLAGLVIVAFFLYRHFSLVHDIVSTLHQVGDPEDGEDVPWA
jgi:hypothetical protein